MKRFLLAVGGLFLLSSSAEALNKANTGCGLGYVILKNQDGPIFEILAVTTNGTSYNQIFGISSGTLECSGGLFAKDEKLNNFVAKNLDELAQDIAVGEGAYLETLAELMGVPESEKASFYRKLSANFDRIFPSEKVTSAEVIRAIRSL